MKSLKRALVTLLVLTMVLGMVSVASAGFSDVTDSNLNAVASKLVTLGIFTGYTDGTFKPANNITRAEFAAVAVRLLGLESAASYAKGATKFSDVGADHWASGYINVASDQGIIKGYPDGTFKPEANVTYAESLAMLIRVLGYEPVVSGTWPTNYIVKAASLGLTKGMTFAANNPATRADVALFADNSLTVPLLEQTVFGTNPQWKPAVGQDGNVTKSILKTNLNAQAVTGIVTDVPGMAFTGLKSGQIGIATSSGPATLTLASGVDASSFLGHKVNAWMNRSGQVVFIEDLTPASRVIRDTIKSADATSITVEGATTSSADDVKYYSSSIYSLLENKIYVAGLTYLQTPAKATIVLDADGKFQFVDAVKFTNPSYVLTEVKATDNIVKYFGSNSAVNTLDLTNKQVIVVRDGKKASLSDLAKNDVLYFADNGSNDKYYLEAYSGKVAGTIAQAIATGSSYTKLVVNGTSYSLASNVTYTSDGNQTVSAADDAAISAMVGKSATLLLDKDGKVRHVDYTAPAAPSNYALVVNPGWDVATPDGVVKYVKLLKADGTISTFATKDSSVVPSGVYAKDLVTFTLNAEGKVDSLTKVTSSIDVTNGSANADYDYLAEAAPSTARYYVTAETLIFNAIPTTPAVTTWANIERSSSVNFKVVTDSTFTSRAKVVVITGGTVTASTLSGVVKSRFMDANGATNLVVVDSNGAEATYTLASSATVSAKVYSNDGSSSTFVSDLGLGDYVSITLDAAGKAASVTEAAYSDQGTIPTTGGVDTVAKMVKLGNTWYQVTSSSLIYDVTGSAPVKVDFSAIAGGQTVQVFASTDPQVVKVLKITAKP